ncbi:MAG TPA: hypothetical protein VL983_06110 [Terriglobales bacterium]|nr:hypothetical protein [Terriglobales bacterium]
MRISTAGCIRNQLKNAFGVCRANWRTTSVLRRRPSGMVVIRMLRDNLGRKHMACMDVARRHGKHWRESQFGPSGNRQQQHSGNRLPYHTLPAWQKRGLDPVIPLTGGCEGVGFEDA